jgi:hypothetical protein
LLHALSEHQHEISTLDETRSLVFGTEDTGYLTLVRPVVAAEEMRAGDTEPPQEDGAVFGRDFAGPKSRLFEIGVLTDAPTGLDNGDPHRANLDHLDQLEGWWRDERLRNHPQTLAMLRSCEAGRITRVYGRPRDYEEVAGPLTRVGYTPVVCVFVMLDDRFYADEESSETAGLAPPPDGGLVAPLVAPLTTTLESLGQGAVIIGGARSTWIVVEFHGPVLNPSAAIGDSVVVGLVGSVPDQEVVTVDPRPWSRGVTRGDGANQAGLLAPSTPPLRDLRLPPGVHQVTYRGTDATATSTCVVRWRDARSRP